MQSKYYIDNYIYVEIGIKLTCWKISKVNMYFVSLGTKEKCNVFLRLTTKAMMIRGMIHRRIIMDSETFLQSIDFLLS